MFEVKLQTYWADTDAAGIVYFSHFFRLVEQAEEELFRASGKNRQTLLEENQIWMPRVEAFSKFQRPIRNGMAVRVRLNPRLKGQKTIRYEFEILPEDGEDRLAEGYVTIVVVDRSRFKGVPVPESFRKVLGLAQ